MLTLIPALTHMSSTDPASIAGVFAVLGGLFHLSILPLEIDYRPWVLLASYTGIYVTLVNVYRGLYGLGWLSALARATLAGVSFNGALFASIAIYRLYLHRLRRFPGPWRARLSRWYAVERAATSGLKYHLELQKLHQTYGDFVRTGPRELSIVRPSAVQAINGLNSPCLRSTWYSQVSDDVTMISLNSTRDKDVHRRRRKAWDRAFSVKALANYEPRILSKSAVLVSQIRDRMGQPIDATKWSMFLTFDVMGLVGFGKDFHQLENATEHSAIKGLHDQMAVLGFALTVLHKTWHPGRDETPTDVISWLLKAKDENDQSAPPGDKALDEDGRLIIIAGSDTTGATLANALYYLTTHPSVYRQLQQHLDTIFRHGDDASFSYDKVRNIPYLEAIINETLRLKPAVPSGQPRVTPAAGLQIDEVWIPGDVNVIIPQYVIQRDERYFPRGAEFVPERWLEGKGGVNEQAYFPFQIGPYGCVGKQLALMELRVVLARIALNFDLFAHGEDASVFDQEARDTFTLSLSPLQLVFRERTIVSSHCDASIS